MPCVALHPMATVSMIDSRIVLYCFGFDCVVLDSTTWTDILLNLVRSRLYGDYLFGSESLVRGEASRTHVSGQSKVNNITDLFVVFGILVVLLAVALMFAFEFFVIMFRFLLRGGGS